MLLLPATLTAREANDTLRMLQQGLRAQTGDTLLVDASGLQHFDSAALAVLLECQRLASAWGKRFEVRQLPTQLANLAGLYGIDELLPLAAAPEVPVVA
ncbi:STAS domain-containing protein [Caldimonas brevitalea]|uniref:Anti-sigma-factor antagonist n=1 Tax=Caldimonas brevitalea TaxID=413882 RepID=A0A0G3BEC6_9BURK|nr:STAS domain-containing protein [Caldimonas brevitalea]AKJ27662.1 anti-sigma-factor antagonist [Caldimonas brevitalea]